MNDDMSHRNDEEVELTFSNLGRPMAVTVDAYVERRKEKFREKVALPLTYAVIVVAIAPIIAVMIQPDNVAAIKEIVTLVLPAITAVYGAIVGFYFGRIKG